MCQSVIAEISSLRETATMLEYVFNLFAYSLFLILRIKCPTSVEA